jgi:hypothetical protein
LQLGAVGENLNVGIAVLARNVIGFTGLGRADVVERAGGGDRGEHVRRGDAAREGQESVGVRRAAGWPIPGDTPYERMLFVLGRVTRAMQREPMLTEAMTRAFMFADPARRPRSTPFARLMERIFTRAMHEGEPTADEIAIAPVIGDVGLSSLVAW